MAPTAQARMDVAGAYVTLSYTGTGTRTAHLGTSQDSHGGRGRRRKMGKPRTAVRTVHAASSYTASNSIQHRRVRAHDPERTPRTGSYSQDPGASSSDAGFDRNGKAKSSGCVHHSASDVSSASLRGRFGACDAMQHVGVARVPGRQKIKSRTFLRTPGTVVKKDLSFGLTLTTHTGLAIAQNKNKQE